MFKIMFESKRDLKFEVKRLSDRCAFILDLYKSSNRYIDTLLKQRDTLKSTIADLEKENNELNSEIDTLNKRNRYLQNRIEQFEPIVQKITFENRKLINKNYELDLKIKEMNNLLKEDKAPWSLNFESIINDLYKKIEEIKNK